MIWDQLTSSKLSQLDRNIPVVLVMAATEQHGSHLPLATDRLIGEYFAMKLHDVMSDEMLILPTISVGCSNHHMQFPGTLSLVHNHFAGQVFDIISSVIKHDFKKIILLNSHGGNQGIGQVQIERLGHQFPEAHFVLTSWWQIAGADLKDITQSKLGGVGHGGEFETSLMMLIAPELVVNAEIKTKSNIPTFLWAEGDMLHGPQATYYRPIHEMTSNGVFGEPMAASAEKGKRIAERVLTGLKQVIIDLYKLQ